MKIKGVIKNLKKLKCDDSKNVSRHFSGAVVGSVRSVQLFSHVRLFATP